MSGVKRYCITCKHEGHRIKDGSGGEEIYCNYKNKWINNYDRQSEWCSSWSFIHGDDNNSPSFSEPNPLERIISGIGYSILIILQVIALPVLILTFFVHPILSVGKAIRVIISAVLLYFMVIIAVFVDVFMLAIWIVSFGFVKTSKIIIIGYTEELYDWITNHGDFFDLE